MTEAQQHKLLWELWPRACKAQGWKTGDRELRLRVFSLAVAGRAGSIQQVLTELRVFTEANEANEGGAGTSLSSRSSVKLITSAKELNNTDEMDAVFRVCKMLAYDLKGAKDSFEEGQARRFRHGIMEKLGRLAAFPEENPMGVEGARRFLEELIAAKFNHGEIVSAPTLEELTAEPIIHADGRQSPSQLAQLVVTLEERVERYEQLAARRELLTADGRR